MSDSEPWVGRSVARLEDEALLRGQGRFMDDIDPVPHAGHAAILRSALAHARIACLDVSAALAHPGVIGVLTGNDVVALSTSVPGRRRRARSVLLGGAETARYAGEPLAVVVARNRYLAEDAAELIDVDYEPLEPSWTRSRASSLRPLVFLRRRGRRLRARRCRLRRALRVPRWTCCPLETYGVVCDWDEARSGLTAWANFQGPFTLHTVAAAALGLRAPSCG